MEHGKVLRLHFAIVASAAMFVWTTAVTNITTVVTLATVRSANTVTTTTTCAMTAVAATTAKSTLTSVSLSVQLLALCSLTSEFWNS